MKIFLEKLKDKKNLTFEESVSAFEILMTGKANCFATCTSPPVEHSGEG